MSSDSLCMTWEFYEDKLHTSAATLPFLRAEEDTKVVFFHASDRQEFRVVFSPCLDGRETRHVECGDVFTIALRQDNETVAAMGFGNPHFRDSTYRACHLPEDVGLTFWVVIDVASGWVVLGHGSEVLESRVLLMLKLAPSDGRLVAFAHLRVSNWMKAIVVRAEISAQSTNAALSLLLKSQHKFDLQGLCTRITGATTVCALLPVQPLHVAMSKVHDAINAEPLLNGFVAFTPPSSYHMTVFDLFFGSEFERRVASFERRDSGPASGDELSEGLRHEAFMQFLAAKFSSEGITSSREWTTFAMRVDNISEIRASLSPWDEETAVALRRWRAAVWRALGRDFIGQGKWYPGKITRVRNGDGDECNTYDIAYDDGESEIRVPGDLIRPLMGGSSAARPVKPRLSEGDEVEGYSVPRCAGTDNAAAVQKGEYLFHATISYPLFPVGMQKCVAVTKAMQKVREAAKELQRSFSGPVFLRAPALCYFVDMGAFIPVIKPSS